MASLSRLILSVPARNIPKTVSFYNSCIGLPIVRVTDEWAELDAGNHVVLTLQADEERSVVVTEKATSPWIMFHVDSLPTTIAACCQAGAALDGPVEFKAYGSVAVMTTPDGHSIALYQPKKE